MKSLQIFRGAEKEKSKESMTIKIELLHIKRNIYGIKFLLSESIIKKISSVKLKIDSYI